jgi:hypothetical protein
VAEQANKGWRIHPNPATDVVVLDTQMGAISGSDFCIRIFNSSGQLVAIHAVPSWPVRLNVESLPTGLYFFQLTGVPAAFSPTKGRFVKS